MATQTESSEVGQNGPDTFDYTYEKLPSHRHIRVLQLDPGTSEDLISLSLIPASFDSLAHFEALSYTWGDATVDRQTVLCGGRLLNIGRNLHSALRHLRLADRGRLLWADAICINQNDIEERNQQVQLMAQIYSTASRTLIWLGEETTENSMAFPALERFFRASSIIDWDRILDTGRADNRFVGLIHQTFGSPLAPEMTQIGRLLSLPWFSRKWIVQELLLSAEPILVLGHRQAPWEHLKCFIRYVSAYKVEVFLMVPRPDDPRPSKYFRHAGTLELGMFLRRGAPSSSLLQYATMFCFFSCKDPRDHVIGLLGTADDVSPADMAKFADYNRPAAEIFLLFAKWCILEQGSLGILSLKTLLPPESSTLPSWAPDLEMLSAGHPTIPLYQTTFSRASSKSKVVASLSQGNLLSLRGRILDRIIKVGTREMTRVDDESIHQEPDSQAALAYVQHPAKFLDEIEEMYSWPDEAQALKGGLPSYFAAGLTTWFRAIAFSKKRKAFLRALLGDIENKSSLGHLAGFEHALRGCRMIGGMVPGTDAFQILATFLTARALRWEIDLNQFFCRYFCRTEKTRFGWVPRSAKEGDLICVFDGGATPYVIRRTEEGRHLLLGDCYIQGLMIGEGMKLAPAETIVLE